MADYILGTYLPRIGPPFSFLSLGPSLTLRRHPRPLACTTVISGRERGTRPTWTFHQTTTTPSLISRIPAPSPQEGSSTKPFLCGHASQLPHSTFTGENNYAL